MANFKFKNNNNDFQARGWCLTINNPVDFDKELLEKLTVKDSVLYLAAQMEVGKQGTEHIQLYIEFVSPHYFLYVKNMFPRAHIEKRKGTPHEAFQYCLKHEGRSSNYWCVTSQNVPKMYLSKQINWFNLCTQTSTLYQFQKLYEYIYIKNKKFVDNYYLNISRVPKKRDVEVIVLVGGTGIGKTSYVYDLEENVYDKDHTDWWDGYAGDPVVLIDEYSGQWPIEYLLKLLGGFRMQLQVKGSYVSAMFTKVYIASNLRIRDWYPNANGDQFRALYRRINFVYTRDSFSQQWRDVSSFFKVISTSNFVLHF